MADEAPAPPAAAAPKEAEKEAIAQVESKPPASAPEQKKSDDVLAPAAPAAQSQPAPQSSGGGWGWGGGWLSSVASYVQPTLSTVVTTSASLVKDLGAVIEADSDDDERPQGAAKPQASEQKPAAASSDLAPPAQPHPGEALSPAQKILEPLTASGAAPEPSASSDGWDDGDDVLDDLIGKGTQLVSQGAGYVRGAWENTGVKDSELVKGAAEGAQTVGSKTVDLLDAVGRHSLRFLTAQVGDPNKPRLVPIVPLPSTAVPVATAAPAAAETMPTFEGIFEEASGPKSLQQLERLSTESLRKIQQQQRKLSTAKLLAFNANVERIQTVLFAEEEKPLPAALAAQLATTREQVADLTKEAKNSPDPVSALRKESILVLAKRAATGVIAVQTLIESIVRDSEATKPTVDSLTTRTAEVQALGAAHSALATKTAEVFSEAVRSLSAATPDVPPSPAANHIYVDGAAAAASVADAVRFVLPVFQSLLIALAAE